MFVTTVSGCKTLKSTLGIKVIMSSTARHKSPRLCKYEMQEVLSFPPTPNMPHAVRQNHQIIKIILHANCDYICVYTFACVLLQPIACSGKFFCELMFDDNVLLCIS